MTNKLIDLYKSDEGKSTYRKDGYREPGCCDPVPSYVWKFIPKLRTEGVSW